MRILTAILLAACVAALSAENSPHTVPMELSGRDFVRLGEFTGIEGILGSEDGEWFLDTGEAIVDLHFGNHEYRAETGMSLEEGGLASVSGYLFSPMNAETGDMAVCTIITHQGEYHFREACGTPLWRGAGQNTSN